MSEIFEREVVALDCWKTLIKPEDELWNNIGRFLQFESPHHATLEETLERSKQINERIDRQSGDEQLEYTQEMRLNIMLPEFGIDATEDKVLKVVDGITRSIERSDQPAQLMSEHIEPALRATNNPVIISNSGLVSGMQTRLILERLGIAHHFSKMYFSDEIGFAKPDTRIFQHVLDDLDVSSGQLYYFGDNPKLDVDAPRSIGINAVLVDEGDNLARLIYDSVPSQHFIDRVALHDVFYDVRFSMDKVFNPRTYSFMKFGVLSAIESISEEISEIVTPEATADRLVFAEVVNELTSSSTYITRAVVRAVNAVRTDLGLSEAKLFQLSRGNDHLRNYAATPAYKRKEDGVDELLASSKLDGEDIIIVDDIYVSGAFSDAMAKTLRQLGAGGVSLYTYARLHISEHQRDLPLEDMLNNTAVAGLEDIDPYTSTGDFIPTRRYFKLLLNSSDIQSHLEKMPEHIREEVSRIARLVMDTQVAPRFSGRLEEIVG